jgi:hypothetical protein
VNLENVIDWAFSPTTKKNILIDCRTNPNHNRPKDAHLFPTAAVFSHAITIDIKMIDICCHHGGSAIFRQPLMTLICS